MKVSFCAHVWNEADAIRRLVFSSLPFADLIDEWVILDHRSSDNIEEVFTEIKGVLQDHRIHFTTVFESRDLSAQMTFADVRTKTIKACRNEIVVLHDADFVLGPGFRMPLEKSIDALMTNHSLVATAYAVPVVWDRLSVDESGTIRDHGRIWVHSARQRIFLRNFVHFEQKKDKGRWEQFTITHPKRRTTLFIPDNKNTELLPSSIVSVNVKPRERIALRDTMTMFMQDVISAGLKGTWLENYAAGKIRRQPPYIYRPVDLRGWQLYSNAFTIAYE